MVSPVPQGGSAAPGVPSAVTLPTDRAGAVIAASLDGIVTIDADGVVLDVNPAAEEIFGWSRAEAVGHDVVGLYAAPETADEVRPFLVEHLRSGSGPALNRRVRAAGRTRDGRRLVLELTAIPVPGSDPPEFVGFVRDITDLRRAQKELYRSRARYQAIIRHSARLVVVCAPWRGESVVLAGESTLGHPHGTVLEDGFGGLVHPEDRERFRAMGREVQEGRRGPADGVDLRLRHADGRWVLCEVVGEDLRGEPAVDAMLFRAMDVTDDRARRHALEDAAARMAALLDHLESAVLLEDGERRVIVANRPLVDLFGIPREPAELVGADCGGEAAAGIAHVFADPEAFLRRAPELLRSGEQVVGEELALADGRVVERDFVPVHSEGRPIGHLWVYRDVSQRVAAQRVLEEQNRSLEELSALKNEFVARVSHELRSPLTSIVSFAELLADPALGSLTPEQAQFLEVISRNTGRLLRLIEDLLLMARLEAHTLPLQPEPLDVADLLGSATSEMLPRAAEAGVVLDLDPVPAGGPPLMADQVRLQQVLANLVGNAVHYTPRGGSVRLGATSLPGSWQVVVEDTGVGIPDDDLPLVFESFHRASTAAGRTGTGLGLPISRLIVEEHGGTLTATSTVGRGTTMTVTLPVRTG